MTDLLNHLDPVNEALLRRFERLPKADFGPIVAADQDAPVIFGGKMYHPDWRGGRDIIRGGATQAPPQAAPPQLDPLRFMRTKPFPVLQGSLPAGGAGGTAASLITWNPSTIPEVPAWTSAIDLLITLPIALVLQAGKSAAISPYAPYSAFSVQMILAGSPEWPSNTSLVPFWLDEIVHSQNFDPMGVGPATVADIGGNFGQVTKWFDRGPTPNTFAAGATTVLPGTTVTNGGGGPATTHFTWQFTVRIRLQRKRSVLWGSIPLGDPQNRPLLKLQLNGLVGNQPENNPIQDVAAGGAVATVDVGGVVCQAVFRSKSLDILPPSVQALPNPLVQLGLNVTYDNSFQIANSGSILYQYQRTAQIYESIHHCFINNAAPVDVDYFGLWLTQDRSSARWEYDSALGTMQDYFVDVFHRYQRYLPNGYFIADLDGGAIPQQPKETPYNALMSPDTGYAAAAGVAPTPNMATAFRIPQGVGIVGAYVALFTFGLVRVPY